MDYNYEDITEDDAASQGRDAKDGPMGHGHNIDNKATGRGRNAKGKSRSRNTKNKATYFGRNDDEDATHEDKVISRSRNTKAKPTRYSRNSNEAMGPTREDDTMNATHKDDTIDGATDAAHEDEDVRVDSDYHEPLGSEHVAEDNNDEPRSRQKVSNFILHRTVCNCTSRRSTERRLAFARSARR